MRTISEFIAQHHEAILARWLEQARLAASARGLDDPELRNIMPRYLASVAAGEEGSQEIERHFAARLRQGFQLAEIVEEFALLGRCIVERALAGPVDEQPDAAEIDVLNARLHRASALVVSMFDEHMSREEQLEKRYVRILRETATAALHGGTTALNSGLRQLLDVIMEAMGASNAAILLRNGEAPPIAVVTAGAGPLDAHRLEAETRSVAASATAAEASASLWEVSSFELAMSEPLRRMGIGAMLAVHLTSRSGLAGMMVVGVSEPRAFTEREHRRFENLAGHLVAHLETVVLVEALTDVNTALRTERSIREQFVSVLAHDLRGPLSAAKLGAELLVQEPTSLETRRDLSVRIERNLDRLDRMIRDLLDANRIRAGERLPLRLDTCDLALLADQVAEELRVMYGDRFVVDADRRAVGVWSADELRRALWNLAINAVKYGEPGRPITFTVRRVDGSVIALVHNHGPAISAEDQIHLFEPFARSRDAIDTGLPGWGLGLTIVLGCAQAHGGTASLVRSDETGTTFRLELPIDARPYQVHANLSEGASVPSVH